MDQVEREPILTWLFWLSNTPYPTLWMLFYPETYFDRPIKETLQDLHKAQKRSVTPLLTLIDQENSSEYRRLINSCPNIFQLHLVVCLRWMALFFPSDRCKRVVWFEQMVKSLQALPNNGITRTRFERSQCWRFRANNFFKSFPSQPIWRKRHLMIFVSFWYF